MTFFSDTSFFNIFNYCLIAYTLIFFTGNYDSFAHTNRFSRYNQCTRTLISRLYRVDSIFTGKGVLWFVFMFVSQQL